MVCTSFAGGPVGLSTLAAAVGEEADTIEDVLEPYLLQRGFLSARRGAAAPPRAPTRTWASSRPRQTANDSSSLCAPAWPTCSSARTAATARPRPSATPASAARRSGCSKCGFAFLFELLDDYYPAPNAAFFVCDQQGRVIGCGRGSFELTGLDDERVIGRSAVRRPGLLQFARRTPITSDRPRVGRPRPRQARAGPRRGRPAREGDRRPLPRLRRRRGSAAHTDPVEVTSTPTVPSRAMSDRRRNIFVLLVVAGLVLASLFVIFTKPTKLGLDLRGGVELVYQAQPTRSSRGQPGGAGPRDRRHARARRPPRRRRAGDPAQRVQPDLRRAARRQQRRARRPAGRPGRPALLLRLGAQRPRSGLQARTEQLRGDGRRRSRHGGCAVAVRRRPPRRAVPASRATATTRPTATPTTWSTRRPRRSSPAPRTPRRTSSPTATRRSRPNEEVVTIKPGTVVVQAQQPGSSRPHRRQGHRPVLRAARRRRAQGHGHQEPGAELRPGRRRQRAADRHVRLHGQGPADLAGHHAEDRPARPGGAELRARRRPRTPRASTSRSSSTTASSPSRTSTSSRTRTASTAATARRSRAASRSSPPRSWRTS